MCQWVDLCATSLPDVIGGKVFNMIEIVAPKMIGITYNLLSK